jgi:anti-sigma factor RsiW
MTPYEDKLSAFLDGELPEAEAREIEAALAEDPALQAELEALMAVDTAVQIEFDAQLDEPVPLELAASIKAASFSDTPVNLPDAPSGFGWMTAAAATLMLAIGGVGGYFAGASQSVQVAAAPGWLDDIADYHRVYAGQKRHLVEVGADEADHIQTWLSASIGADVRIPDLSEHGLTFQGARLLVAAGKPVSQLMYTDAEDRVVALCQIQTDTPRGGTAEQKIGAFDLVTWGAERSNFVVIGDEGRSDLQVIAETAASQA